MWLKKQGKAVVWQEKQREPVVCKEKQRVQPQVWALQRALQGQVLSCQLVSLWAVAPVAALHVESLDALLQLGLLALHYRLSYSSICRE